MASCEASIHLPELLPGSSPAARCPEPKHTLPHLLMALCPVAICSPEHPLLASLHPSMDVSISHWG